MTSQTAIELGFRRAVQKVKQVKALILSSVSFLPSKQVFVGSVTTNTDAVTGSMAHPFASVSAALSAKDMADLRVQIVGTYVNATDNVVLTKDNLLVIGSSGLAGGYDTTIGDVSSNGHQRAQVLQCNIGKFTFDAGTGHKLERVNVTIDGSNIVLDANGFCSFSNVDFGGKTLSIGASVGARIYFTDCSNINISSVGTGVTLIGSRCNGTIVNDAGSVGFAASENLRITGAGTNLALTSSYSNATANPSTVGLYILNYAYANGLTEINGASLSKGDGIWYLGTAGGVANCCVRMFAYEQVSVVNVVGATWLKSGGGWAAPSGGGASLPFATFLLNSTTSNTGKGCFQVANGGAFASAYTAISGGSIPSTITLPVGCKVSIGAQIIHPQSITADGGGTLLVNNTLAFANGGAFLINAANIGGTGSVTGASAFVTSSPSAHIFGGTGSGNAGRLACNTLNLGTVGGSIDVYSDGVGISKISLGGGQFTNASTLAKINLMEPMPAGVFTEVETTNTTAPVNIPTIGTNNSGRAASVSWVSGTGLRLTLT
jgi:hypothetical protein